MAVDSNVLHGSSQFASNPLLKNERVGHSLPHADAFNAVAEPRRRQILDVLADGERPVNDIVAELALTQPQVSKHLRVLREVGVVDVRNEGRQRLYRLNGQALKPIHDWVKAYERTWSERFDALDAVLEDLNDTERPRSSSTRRSRRRTWSSAGGTRTEAR
jgi:DNA-binding transcriptional ArsR family regulator